MANFSSILAELFTMHSALGISGSGAGDGDGADDDDGDFTTQGASQSFIPGTQVRVDKAPAQLNRTP